MRKANAKVLNWRAFIVLLAVALPAAAQDAIRPFSADLTVTKQGVSGSGKIYSDGRFVRMEISESNSGLRQLIFVRIPTDTKQLVNSRDEQYVEMPYGTPGDEDFIRYLPGAKVNSAKEGTETLGEYTCGRYLVKTTYKGREYQSVEYRAAEFGGFVIKRQGVDGSWTTEYKNIHFARLPSGLFNIPPGYKKILYSKDWEPVIATLALRGTSADIAAAKQAGLKVETEKEANGDQSVEFLDGVTGSLVAMVHVFVDPLPLPAKLPPPVLSSPSDGTVFHYYPRTTELSWQAVPGATGYIVQVDIQSVGQPESYWASERGIVYKRETTEQTVFRFEFAGAQPGRCRVWVVDAHGNEGAKSDWYTFRYTY